MPVRFPESPFTRYAKYGLTVELPATCEPPEPQVISELLTGWQRIRP